MVELKKIYDQENRVSYSYGIVGEKVVGSIEFDTTPGKDFEERNVLLNYTEGCSFCRTTSSALQAIVKFIRENNFPKEYVRVTH